MAKRSAARGRNRNFPVDGTGRDAADAHVAARAESTHRTGVSISLEYYQQSTECFSHWHETELKKFAGLIEKLKGYSLAGLLLSDLCCKHIGRPKEARFSRPAGIAWDSAMFELRVDRSNLARVHGVFAGNVFQLVWLDRKHRVFPKG